MVSDMQMSSLCQVNFCQRSEFYIFACLPGSTIIIVECVLASAEEAMEKRYALLSGGFGLERVASRVSEELGLRPEEVWAKGKNRRNVEARGLLCYGAVRELGVSMSSLARKLGILIPPVSKSVTRGQRIAQAKKLSILEP